MAMRANVLQGVFFGMFGALTAVLLGLCAMMLLPFLASLVPAKADFGVFPRLPTSVTGSVASSVAPYAFWLVAYSMHRRNMRMSLPMGAKAALFALGAALPASVGVVAYLWARSLT